MNINCGILVPSTENKSQMCEGLSCLPWSLLISNFLKQLQLSIEHVLVDDIFNMVPRTECIACVFRWVYSRTITSFATEYYMYKNALQVSFFDSHCQQLIINTASCQPPPLFFNLHLTAMSFLGFSVLLFCLSCLCTDVYLPLLQKLLMSLSCHWWSWHFQPRST